MSKHWKFLSPLNPELPEIQKALLSRWFSFPPFGGICDRSLRGCVHRVAKLKGFLNVAAKNFIIQKQLEGSLSSLQPFPTIHTKKKGNSILLLFELLWFYWNQGEIQKKKQKNTKWSTPWTFEAFSHPKHVAKVHIHAPGKPGETVVSKCGYLPTYLLP